MGINGVSLREIPLAEATKVLRDAKSPRDLEFEAAGEAVDERRGGDRAAEARAGAQQAVEVTAEGEARSTAGSRPSAGSQASYLVTTDGAESVFNVTVLPALFGSSRSVCDAKALVHTLPEDGCGTLQGGLELFEGKYAIVRRGGCEFLMKALNAAEAGAAGILVINYEAQPLVAMPMGGGTGAHQSDTGDVGIPAAMMSHADGAYLFREIDGEARGEIKGQLFLHGSCVDEAAVEEAAARRSAELAWDGSSSAEATAVRSGQLIVTGGTMGKQVFEFLTAAFGGMPPVSEGSAACVLHRLSNPADGCTELQTQVHGMWAVVERGGCSFVEKVRNVQRAGAVGVIVLNNEHGLVHMPAGELPIAAPPRARCTSRLLTSRLRCWLLCALRRGGVDHRPAKHPSCYDQPALVNLAQENASCGILHPRELRARR